MAVILCIYMYVFVKKTKYILSRLVCALYDLLCQPYYGQIYYSFFTLALFALLIDFSLSNQHRVWKFRVPLLVLILLFLHWLPLILLFQVKNKSRTPKKPVSYRKRANNWDFADDDDEALKQVKGFLSSWLWFSCWWI